MRFGKHKGLPFENIPQNYLVWLRDNAIDNLFRYEIDEIDRLLGRETAHSQGPSKSNSQAAYRELALCFHPDRDGGNGRIMQEINRVFDKYELK